MQSAWAKWIKWAKYIQRFRLKNAFYKQIQFHAFLREKTSVVGIGVIQNRGTYPKITMEDAPKNDKLYITGGLADHSCGTIVLDKLIIISL